MPNVNDPAIAVRGLQKRFGDLEALAGIDFEVAPATVFGLLGPNGAGKTTAVRILTTILQPDGGTAEVLGFDVVRDPERVRLRIGLAGQAATVDPNLTGRENLRLVGRLAQRPRAWMDLGRPSPGAVRALPGRRPTDQDVLRDAAPAGRGRRPRRTAPGPVPRRAHDGPGPPEQERAWRTIRDLVADGTTVLLTTQYLEEADQLAERIAVVDIGSVIAEGTPSELKAQLGSTVIEFDVGELDAHRARGPGLTGPTPEREGGSGCPTRGPQGADGDAQALDAQGCTVVAHRARAQPGRRLPPADRTPRRAGGRVGSAQPVPVEVEHEPGDRRHPDTIRAAGWPS